MSGRKAILTTKRWQGTKDNSKEKIREALEGAGSLRFPRPRRRSAEMDGRWGGGLFRGGKLRPKKDRR